MKKKKSAVTTEEKSLHTSKHQKQAFSIAAEF